MAEPPQEPYQISEIIISNFKSIPEEIAIKAIQKTNNLVGLNNTLKKDIAAAIIFALGATLNEINAVTLQDVCNHDGNSFVELVLVSGRIGHKVRREINRIDQIDGTVEIVEVFLENQNPKVLGAYKDFLKTLNFDLDKQFHFYDAANRKLFWNIVTSEQDELIALLTNTTEDVRSLLEAKDIKKRLQTAIDQKTFVSDYRLKDEKKLHDVLPTENEELLDDAYRSNLLQHLRREEAERITKRTELTAIENDFNQINGDNATLLESIESDNGTLDGYKTRNSALLAFLQEEALRPFQTKGLLALQTEILFLGDAIEHNKTLILDNESLLLELERYKSAAESHIAFMNSGSGQASNMITEDALRKLYPIYHLDAELEMDEIEFNLISKEEKQNTIDDKKMLFNYFETAYPEQRLRPMEESIEDMCKELNDALKGVFDVNSYLPAEDDLRYEIIKAKIPKSVGFMLRSAFEPIDDQMQNLIDNILCDFKYTIVLYKPNEAFMRTMLDQNKELFQNVNYLVISVIEQLEPSGVRDDNHWLNYCRYIGNGKVRDTLLNYMQVRVNINCVGSHDDVRNNFRNHVQQYVASLDGQLIYTRNMSIDVLVYFKPGEKRKRMHFPEAAQRLTDAHDKFAQWMSSIFDPEKVPRVNDIDDSNELRAEVDVLKASLAQKKQLQANEMEALRRKMDAPFSVPDIPNFDVAKVAEEAKLKRINDDIAKFRNEIALLVANNLRITEEADNIQTVVNYKTQLKSNETDILILTKAIKEKEQQAKRNEKPLFDLTEKKEKLEQDMKNLKYRTMSLVLQANMNIPGMDWNNWQDVVTTPPTLFQDFVHGNYVDPMAISIQFSQEADVDLSEPFYGRRDWFNILTRVREQRLGLGNVIQSLRDIHHNIKEEENRLLQRISVEFIRLNGRMSDLLNTIAQQIYPEDRMEFDFNFFVHQDVGTSDMIIIQQNGCVISVENMSYLLRIRIHWLVFAAFHQYSHAPFVFIDLSNVQEDVIDMIAPIINLIQGKSQMFINSSHIHHIRFANLQIGVNVTKGGSDANANNTIQIITHDGEQHIAPAARPDTPDGPDGPGGISSPIDPNHLMVPDGGHGPRPRFGSHLTVPDDHTGRRPRTSGLIYSSPFSLPSGEIRVTYSSSTPRLSTTTSGHHSTVPDVRPGQSGLGATAASAPSERTDVDQSDDNDALTGADERNDRDIEVDHRETELTDAAMHD